MDNLVSLIIPVYNVEDFLDKCLFSVINQTYSNIEIIIVNDGSTDKSEIICKKYGDLDKRIKYYFKENGGLSSARNYGLEKSQGEYIMFLDSDDFLCLNAVEVLMNYSKKTNSDVSIGKIVLTNEQEEIEPKILDYSNIEYFIYDNISAIENMLYEKQFSSSANRILYKAKLFDGVRFPVGKTYEDMYTVYKLFYKCNIVTYVDFPVYYYLIRYGSIVSNLNPLRNIDFLNASIEIHDFIKEKCPNKVGAADYKMFVSSIELFVKYPAKKSLSNIDSQKRDYIWKTVKEKRFKVLIDRNSSIKYRVLAFFSYFGQRTVTTIYKIFAKR